jgi:cytochrome c
MQEERAPRTLSLIEPRLREVILEGQALWHQPPSTENTIACATCHFDGAEIRGWAASFPKVKPMPSPFTRVMTLQQVVSEALARHYRIRLGGQNRSPARAVTAYLVWVGEGRPLTPGVAPGQPRLPDRLAALRESIARGQDQVRRTCAGCHTDAARFAEAAAVFPRVPRDGGSVVTLEEYLEGHVGLAWDGTEVADVMAFLAARARGRHVEIGGTLKLSHVQGG